MRVLSILLWKHMKERWRRLAHTIWEIVGGLMVFVALLLVKQLVVENNQKKIHSLDDEVKLVDVIFAPRNDVSESLLYDICTKSIEKYNYSPGSGILGSSIRCYGFRNQTEINNFLDNHVFPKSEAVIVILIEDIDDGNSLPKDLKYSIKFVKPATYRSVHFEGLFYGHAPLLLEKNATLFANMQWDIDKSYMEMLTGKAINHELSLKSVPEHISPEMSEIHSLLAICTVLAPLPFFMTTNAALVDEKRTGIKAMLKLCGVSQNLMNFAYLIDTAMFANIYAVLTVTLLNVTATPVLKFSMPIIIWFTLILHFMTITSTAFITSTLSHNYQHSDSMSILVYLMMFLINKLWVGYGFGKSAWLTILYILIPHAPVFMFWNDVVAAEALGEGTTFKNIYKNHSPSGEGCCVLLVWFLFPVQLLLFFMLSWYLELVKPGAYGVALPWNFIFKKSFWHRFCNKKGLKLKKQKRRVVNFHVTAEKRQKVLRDDRFFQPKQKGDKTAIKIAEVSKVFKERKSSITIVEHASMDVYKGAITVLLGPSGAGKTCLISIVTGMCSATSGHVYINGYDIEARLHDVRNDVAYCPQKDMTIDYLTVQENIVFFQHIKVLITKDNQESSGKINVDHLMKVFKMDVIADFYTRELPLGQRKCLQIVCTLIADTDVVIFDEPSHGMDADMRHRFWDVLLTLRKSKTIFMSSSYMDEADALADRIALMQNGRIRCFASPAFLKNAIGADVQLSIRLSDKVNIEMVEEVVRRIIKDAGIPNLDNLTVTRAEKNGVIISLPARQRDHFPKLFDMLEASCHNLGIMAMNIGVSMEQVFLRFVEDSGDEDQFIQLQDHPEEILLTGRKLRNHRLCWLIKRAWKYVWDHKYQFIFVQVLVPLIAFIIITLATNQSSVKRSEETRDNSIFQFRRTKVFYHPVGKYRRFNDHNPINTKNQNVEFISSSNVPKDIVRLNNKLQKELVGNRHYVLGIRSDSLRTDIYYPLTSAPVLSTAINIFSNQFLAMNVPKPLGRSIQTTILPFETKRYVEPKKLYLCYVWSMWVTFLVIIPLGPLIRLCVEEYYNGARFNHLLMGCQPFVIWLSKLFAHMAIYIAIVPWSILIVAWLLDSDRTLSSPDFLCALLLLLVIFGPAHLIHWYVLSFLLSAKKTIAKMYIISLLLGLVTPIFLFFLNELSNQWPGPIVIFLYILYVLASFIPTFTFSVCLAKITKVARNNAFCQLNYELCPDNLPVDTWVSKEVCCSSNGKPYSYYGNFHTGLYELIFILLQCIIYWILLLMFTNRIIQPIGNKFCNLFCPYGKPPVNLQKNINVTEEENFVHEKMKILRALKPEERKNHPEMLLAEGLFKSHRKGCRKVNHTVRGVSFSVNQGECLIILGQNGSGKTTTLAMVAGFEVMSSGDTYVNGCFWKKERTKYLHNVTWCKGKGFDEFLSGLENIQLLAALFGYKGHDALRIAIRDLQYMGLFRYSDLPFRSYSLNCAQRLAVCSALVGSPHAALLDQLCSFVDPYTRPFVTRAIQRLLENKVAVVMAEETLDWKEIDEFCTRLAIIDRGELVAIDKVSSIRRDFASGYTVKIKLVVDKAYQLVQETAGTTSLISIISGKSMIKNTHVEDLKKDFFELFKTSVLVDEHMSMLYFHIKDTVKGLTYSSMYEKLEELSNKYDMIEDYILTETSIEEILNRIFQLRGDSDEERGKSLKILKLD